MAFFNFRETLSGAWHSHLKTWADRKAVILELHPPY